MQAAMRQRDLPGVGILRGAEISECGRYRYWLTRQWSRERALVFILLNPSTADEFSDDATTTRCINRAVAGGYGGIIIANLFAWRATDPEELRNADDPVGPHNDLYIEAAARQAGAIVCGWGDGGHYRARGEAVEMKLRQAGHGLHHLGLTKNGAPRHPLYVAGKQVIEIWEPGE